MSLPTVTDRDTWLAARKDLLQKEKDLTRRRDQLSVDRRNLPMVEVDKPYRFFGDQGPVGLLDLFEGRRQLIIYHFMFDPDWDEGCRSCSCVADNIGDLSHLHARDHHGSGIPRTAGTMHQRLPPARRPIRRVTVDRPRRPTLAAAGAKSA
jgi:predicted dithiol-disulfide oxidoreductase (DUF899 family)